MSLFLFVFMKNFNVEGMGQIVQLWGRTSWGLGLVEESSRAYTIPTLKSSHQIDHCPETLFRRRGAKPSMPLFSAWTLDSTQGLEQHMKAVELTGLPCLESIAKCRKEVVLGVVTCCRWGEIKPGISNEWERSWSLSSTLMAYRKRPEWGFLRRSLPGLRREMNLSASAPKLTYSGRIVCQLSNGDTGRLRNTIFGL